MTSLRLARAPQSVNTNKSAKPRTAALSQIPRAVTHEPAHVTPQRHSFQPANFSLAATPSGPSLSSPTDAAEQEAQQASQRVLDAPSRASLSTPSAAPRPTRPTPQALAAYQASGRSVGSPIPPDLLSFFQPRFGHDLGNVRLHTGDAAAEGAHAIQARAYTAGHNILFAPGQYAPHTASGRQLLAHELTHVVQNRRAPAASSPVLMRTPLSSLGEADRQSLKLDTDNLTGSTNLREFFGLKGTPVLATNVTDSVEFETPQIDAVKDPKVQADLRQGLRLFALSRFDLLPDEKGKATSKRLRMVHLEGLDLTRFGGPNAMFRFTSLGSSNKGAITVRILVEEMPTPAPPMADAAKTPDIERRKVVPYGLKRGATVSDPIWQKVLRSLGSIDESLIMRVRDIGFEVSEKQLGPTGEAASFDFSFRSGPWTKTITLYQKILSASDAEFATLLAHEMGHAVDAAPSEKTGGKTPNAEAHDSPEFKEAAKKDGGRGKSITDYGGKNDSEFYAECLSLFVQQPETLRALRPNIYLYFFKYEWAAVRDPKLNAPSLAWSTSKKYVP